MTDESAVQAADTRFFDALLAADPGALEHILTADFLIIDVFTGSVTPRDALIGAVAEGIVRFESIEQEAADVRVYGDAAVVTGSTRMNGTMAASAFGVHSRYTHVYVVQLGEWRLASAQGTPIAEG